MSINKRKHDHLQVVLDEPAVDRNHHFFDEINLTHRALPELNFEEISTETDFLGKKLNMPFLIASMTGGKDKKFQIINRRLAEAAQEVGVAMGVGSQRIQIDSPEAEESFNLRKYASDIPLIANLGAVQLNDHRVTFDNIKHIISTLEADALFLHLNPLQEVIQEKGDVNFKNLVDKIRRLNEQLSIPVIIKEVGSGLSTADIQLGIDADIKWFDLAGRGGTSWSRVEAVRNNLENDGILFQDWGIPTPYALKQAQKFKNQANFIASGGLRNGLDLAKSLILGAHLGSMARPLLKTAMVSKEATIQHLEKIKRQLQTSMFLLGISRISELRHRKDLILP
ncbi:MAG: type 2 isopentenyl-diphosphate Delta-isomerase [Candidatus Electrothrix sp. AR3]|nr:type 2 isopentenyl-diphosphate Delta-isomerase [Candidatus Electrothrix sp. AR3]